MLLLLCVATRGLASGVVEVVRGGPRREEDEDEDGIPTRGRARGLPCWGQGYGTACVRLGRRGNRDSSRQRMTWTELSRILSKV